MKLMITRWYQTKKKKRMREPELMKENQHIPIEHLNMLGARIECEIKRTHIFFMI